MVKINCKAVTWPSPQHNMIAPVMPYRVVATEPVLPIHRPALDNVMNLAWSSELGFISLDRSGEVIEMNLAARELIAMKDGLVLTERSIEASCPADSAALAEAVRAVIRRPKSSTDQMHSVAMLRISRMRTCSLLIAVVPSEKPAADGAVNDPAALIMISDPDRPLHESVRTVCQLYRLTPAETRLTEHLIDGFTLAEIAEIMNLKPSTIRVYLKQVFAKTGVKRQAMLIRLFLTMRLPFNFPATYLVASRASQITRGIAERLDSCLPKTNFRDQPIPRNLHPA